MNINTELRAKLEERFNWLTWRITDLHDSNGDHIYELMDERHQVFKELNRRFRVA
jgi:hypothetical protein